MQRSRIATYLFAILLALVTLGYGLFEARTLIKGPQVTIYEPTPNSIVTGTIYTVRGKAEGVTRVRLNGRTVTLDARGGFEETIIVPVGDATLVLEAENRFGRRTEERIPVYGKRTTVAATTASSTPSRE
ncbi:MAG: hypothetical protein KBD21_05065 [Candidatus Pacebacteria bacterium]|nr:hypothetical protein [Candidatus Paceibacterota bacterium]